MSEVVWNDTLDAGPVSELVLQNAKDLPMAIEAIGELEDFVEAMRSGIAFSSDEVVDERAARQVLSWAAGGPVNTVSVRSTRRDARDFVEPETLVNMTLLSKPLAQTHHARVHEALGDDLWGRLADTLCIHVGDAVLVHLRSRLDFWLGAAVGEGMANTIAFLPSNVLYYVLAYAIIGDRENFEGARRLFQLCRCGLPVGKFNRPKSPWLILRWSGSQNDVN
ncbi:MAG: hypothetical protein PHT12_06240 [Patescibacteria group bacterium]|nr:hypothetical protein [Patescibacteria group bacterium]